MKKIIACTLSFCMMVTMATFGSPFTLVNAIAESVAQETAASTQATATPAPQQTATTVSVVVADSSTTAAAATATPAPQVTATPATQETESETTPQPEASVEPAAAQEADTTTEPETTADPEATLDPDATAEPEATVDPDATVDPEATLDPEAILDPDATVTPEVTETPAPTAEPNVGSGPVWITEGAHRRYGELDELLPIAMLNHDTIFICTTSVIKLTNYSASELGSVGFGIDEDALGEDYCDGKTVIISAISKSGSMYEDTLYIWVGKASDIPSAADALGDAVDLTGDEEVLETEIMVDAAGFTAGEVCTPSFTLTAYPELSDGQTFAVVKDGGDASAIAGNTYQPTSSGEYRFAVLDASGTLLARSMAFDVLYATAEEPEVSTEPAASTEPETTGQPAASETPETAGEPDATVEPEATTTPDATVEPDVTIDPDATEEPEATTDPDATTEPEVTVDPDAAVEPEATVDPDATEEPAVLTADDLLDGVTLGDSPADTEGPELTVRAYDYSADVLSAVTPSFELTGAFAADGYTYGVSINGSEIAQLVSNLYAQTQSGDYTLVFYILNADGEAVAASSSYHTVLDFTQASGNNEAWMQVGSVKVYGTLASLLRQADSGATIYLLTSDVIELSDASKLSSVNLAPDPDVFGSDHCVIVSADDPDGE